MISGVRRISASTVVNLAQVQLGPPAQMEWDDTTLSTVERNLARYVGPMARVLVRKAATRANDVAELYSMLATNINDQEARRQFVAMMTGSESMPSGRTVHTGGAALKSGTSPTVHRATLSQPERSGSVGTRAMPVATPLEPQFVQDTTQRLMVYLGPIGRVVARKAAEQAKSREEFLQILAGHIGTQERAAFLRDVGL